MSRLIVVCLCFLSLAASSWANDKGNDENAVTRGNAYIDELLRDMFDDSDDFDPYKMEDSVVGFSKKVVFVEVSGEAKLHDGTIKGLRTLHRPDDCSLQENGDVLKVKADLGGGILTFHYSGSAKFMNFGPTITVEGELAYIEVQLEFTVDAKTGKNGKLTKFVIDDMRGMKVWISGLGPINWALNPIISAVTKIFKRFVRNFLENRVQKYLAERIPNYQFPVEGGITEVPITTTTEEVTTPTEPETTTEKEITTQTEPETTTEEEVTTQTEPETTTEEDVTTPTEPETTTEEEVTSPTVPESTTEEEVTSPTEPETTAEEEVTSPTEPETTTEEEVTSPTVPESTTEEEVSSPSEPETTAEE